VERFEPRERWSAASPSSLTIIGRHELHQKDWLEKHRSISEGGSRPQAAPRRCRPLQNDMRLHKKAQCGRPSGGDIRAVTNFVHTLERADAGTRPIEQVVVQKVAYRLLPFLVACYFFAYLDRVNLGFAALTMNEEFNFSPTVFSIGAGIFFIGYFLFEVPSNLALERFGASRWIARIMVSWGRDLGIDGIDQRKEQLLRAAVLARAGRGRLLSGDLAVSHLLVSREVPCKDFHLVHRGRPGFVHGRISDFGFVART
jgi:hypothetical protein